jgi:hypothetical protein
VQVLVPISIARNLVIKKGLTPLTVTVSQIVMVRDVIVGAVMLARSLEFAVVQNQLIIHIRLVVLVLVVVLVVPVSILAQLLTAMISLPIVQQNLQVAYFRQ